MDERILVSIIMPSFCSEQYIEASIRSVQAQTETRWELLVSDDGSTDGTLALVRQMQQADSRIRIILSHKNQGAAKARNAAIKIANGRYIAFLDSDDLWKPEKLALQIAFMQERNIAFSFTSYDRLDHEGNFLNTHRVDTPVLYHDLLKSCVIGCLTAVYDTDKLGKVFMPDIRKRQDFGLWLNLLKIVGTAYPVPQSLAQYRVHSASLSANKISAAKSTWSVYRDVEKLGLLTSLYYFSHYALNGVLNTYVKPYANTRFFTSKLET